MKNLELTSEDIEDCPNLDKWMKRAQISQSVADALHLEHGTSSSKKNQEEKAFKMFESAAKKGSAQGLFNMALFYTHGKGGLPRDFPKAVELCRKAASQKAFIRFQEMVMPNEGVSQSESFLAICYRDGRGVDKCSTKAFAWNLTAARHGDPTAQNNLGMALLNGEGCRKNESSARSWFQKAAEQGNSLGQYNYAMVLDKGLGGPIDSKKAGELLKLSADQGNVGAKRMLQHLSMSGALGGSTMKKTKENLEKTALKGDPASLYLLGRNYC